MDSAGALLETYHFDEFGYMDAVSEHHPFGFSGYMTDSYDDTLFAQARHYAPKLGRFISKDTVKGYADNPQTLNEYAYCYNSPLNYVDRDGREPETLDGLWNPPQNPAEESVEALKDFWEKCIVGTNVDIGIPITNNGITARSYFHFGGEIFVIDRNVEGYSTGFTLSAHAPETPFIDGTPSISLHVDFGLKDYGPAGLDYRLNFSKNELRSSYGVGVSADGIKPHLGTTVISNRNGSIYDAVSVTSGVNIDWGTVIGLAAAVYLAVLTAALLADDATGYGIVDNLAIPVTVAASGAIICLLGPEALELLSEISNMAYTPAAKFID
jgi:RHS repeat-associated protein